MRVFRFFNLFNLLLVALVAYPVFLLVEYASKPPKPPTKGPLKAYPAEAPAPTPEFSCAAFSPDGQQLLIGFEKHQSQGGMDLHLPPPKQEHDFEYVSLWDVNSGMETKVLLGHQEDVVFVSFLPDANQAISASKDAMFKVWDLAEGKEIRSMKYSSKAALSNDGLSVFSLSGDLKQWDVNTGKLLKRFDLGYPKMLPQSFIVSPDNRYAFISFSPGLNGQSDNQLWDLAQDRSRHIWEASKGWRDGGAFSPDGKYLMMEQSHKEGREGNLVLFELASFKEVRTFEDRPMNYDFLSLQFSPDGKTFNSYDRDGMFRAWEVATGKEIKAMECEPFTWVKRGVRFSKHGTAVFSQDCKLLFTAIRRGSTYETQMKIWEVGSGKLLRTLPLPRISTGK